MSEEQSKQAEKESVEHKLSWDGRSVDWFLQELVRLVNSSDELMIGITLHVQGSVISGQLISATRYFKELGEVVTNAGADSWGSWIASFGETLAPQDGEEPLPVAYIHLRDARAYFAAGGAIPTNEGVHWRGKINAISGFNIGALSAGKD